MKCKSCNKFCWFNDICKDCENERLEDYRKSHTFVFGEKVKVIQQDKVFCKATVISQGTMVSNFGYFQIPYYKVRFPDKTIHTVEPLLLEKIISTSRIRKPKNGSGCPLRPIRKPKK